MKTEYYGGIGFFGLLGLLFIALKLLDITVVATWSWWLVLLPIWGPVVLGLTGVLIMGLVMLVLALRK